LVGGLRVGLEIIGLSNLWEEFSDTHLGCRFVDFSLVQCKYETIRRKACKKYYFVCPRGVWSCPYCGGEGDGIEPKNQNLEVDEAIEYAEKLNCFLDELEESIVQDDAMSSHPNGTTEEKLKEWHEKFAYYPKE
jgi:Fe-S-cluster containining protein